MEPIRVVHPPAVPWRAYVIILILLIAGPFLFFEWVRHWPRVQPGIPASEPNSWIAASSDSRMQAAAAFKPIHDVQVISDATPRQSLYDLPAELIGVGVRGVSDVNGFWVSQVRTPAVFVAFSAQAKHVPVRWRQSVDVIGHVRRLAARDEIQRRWPGLKGKDLERLEGQGVFVEADQVTINGTY